MSVDVRYFASLRERAGREAETVERPDSLAALYARLRDAHGFPFAPEQLRVAVNGAFVDWSCVVADGDEVVFLPPVSGG